MSTPAKRPLTGDSRKNGAGAGTENTNLTPATEGSREMTRRGSVESDRDSKKKRISLSCAQCAKRKQKCNREFPCNHCLARKVPELCVPYNPTAPPSIPLDPATSARIDRLETVLSFVVRHHGGLWGYRDVKEWMQVGTFQKLFPSSPSGTPRPYPDLDSEREQEFRREIKAFPRVGGSGPKNEPQAGRDAFEMEQSQSVGGDEERLERLGEMEGLPESMESRGKVNMKHDVHGTPAENLQQLIRECGMSPHKLAELVQELPPKQLADKIVNWFFGKLNFARYPIDEQSFRESYEDLYTRSTAIDPSNVRALPLVFIVLALAVRLAPEEWAGNDETRKLSSLRMYWSSRRSILIATAVQSESIELVLSRLLSAMYLVTIHDRRLTECWSQLGASLRTAQAIGLHRDGAKLGLDPHQSEYRRRIWSYLYHADKLYSLVLGRPPSISDSYTDTLPPSNVDLSAFHPSRPPPTPLPLSQPTTATFLILRRSLSTIVGNVVHHFQKLDEPAKYSDVEALQVEMDRFIDGLPPCFRMYDPDKSMDETLFWLPVHRFSLLSEIIMTTIILHRPWLLRRLSSNRYATSRTACFEMAKLDFALRTEHYRDVPDHKVYQSQGQFKMFNSAMIAGISAIIDPRGPDGDTMRQILGTFLELNPWAEVKSKDETTRKEVRIIQTLSRRAAQIYEKSFAPGELSPPERDSVVLLLGLREDNAIPPTPSLGQTVRAQPVLNRDKGWANLINGNNRRLDGQASPGSSVHEDDSQRMLDHWLNANSSLAVGSLTGPFPLDPLHQGSYMPMIPPFTPGPMGMHQTFSMPGTPMAPPGPTRQMSWDGGAMHRPSPSMGNMGMQAMNMNPGYPGPSPLSMAPTDMGLGGMGHGGHGHGHGHVSGDMMFDSGLMSGVGMGMATTPGPTMPYGMGMGDVPMMSGGGENADEYWNTLIDGILGTTSGMGAGGSGA